MNELPSGWATAVIADIVSVNPPPGEPLDPGSEVSFIPMAAVEAESGRMDTSAVRPFAELHKKSFRTFVEGDVLFAKITPCMENGKAAVARNLKLGRGFGSTEFHVLRPDDGINADFLLHFLLQRRFRDAAASNMKGTAGQLRVPASYLAAYTIPIPPSAEQDRIVAAIEEHFSRLDAGVAALERARKNLKRFRIALMQAAVFGRLPIAVRDIDITPERMRSGATPARRRAGRLWGSGSVPQLTEEERTSIPERWKWSKVSELGEDPDATVQVGPMSMRSADFMRSGVPVLNVGCVQWDRIDESKLNYLPPARAESFSRYRIQPGDVLFTRSGTVGRSAVAGERQRDWLMTFHLLRVRVDPSLCLPEYLRMVFEAAPHVRRQARGAAIGTTRAGFNTRLLADIDVPLPSLAEQTAIVRTVQFYLSQMAGSDPSAWLRAAQALRSSILVAAFSGNLVPQDPTDEPASALLERIASKRASSKRHSPRRSRNPRLLRNEITA